MTLPTFNVRGLDFELDDKRVPALIVGCPRKRCRGWFVVKKATWRAASRYETRPCPHCFGTARIPDAQTLKNL